MRFLSAACLVCLLPLLASGASLTLITEPDQGMAAIYNLISSAKQTLDMTMYELTDTQAEQLLAQAAASGVAVRVILDQNLEMSANTPAYNYLSSHGVQVHWANPKYSATHQKTVTVDGSLTAIMTLNLTSQYYSSSRDFAMIESDPADIAAIEATFAADFVNSAVTPGDGDDLAWSPTDSQVTILKVINSATHSLVVENEEMGDATIVSALESAVARGVQVRVVMTNTANEFATEFGQLVSAGAEVATYASDAALYIHAKVILADYPSASPQAFVGSQNFSNASLNQNRELGRTVSDPTTLQGLAAALSSDFQGATPWTGSSTTTVLNAASLEAGFASSGWMTIFGENLAPVTGDWSNSIVGGQLPTALDNVTVSVNGQAAYVAYISPSQINALAPVVNPGAATVIVSGPNGAVATATSVAETAQPAFFAWGSYAVATHADYSLAVKNGVLSGTTVPAAPGEIITLWGAGFGPTNPAVPQGVETPAGVTYYTSSPVAVTLGGTPVTVYGAALAPGFAGLFQVSIQIPDSTPAGDYPLVATVSGSQSPATVLLTVAER